MRLTRRAILQLGVAGTALTGLVGHTPYRQWKVYRQKHLLIGSHRGDPESFVLAQRIAQTLVDALPASSARASRAPDARRVASLLTSNQWQVAVLNRNDARHLVEGRGMFSPNEALPLLGLFAMGEYLLVCRADFPDHHAWLVTATLTENARTIPDGAPMAHARGPLAVHPGARAYATGAAQPEAP